MVILSFLFGPRGTSTVTMSPRLWPSSALPIGDSLESLLLGRVGLGRADDLELARVARLLVLDVDATPTPTSSVSTCFSSMTLRAAQPLLELGDPLLEQRLLVLGVVVLGVLGDVAELARFLDALGDLAALGGREVLDLRLSFSRPSWVISASRATCCPLHSSRPPDERSPGTTKYARNAARFGATRARAGGADYSEATVGGSERRCRRRLRTAPARAARATSIEAARCAGSASASRPA